MSPVRASDLPADVRKRYGLDEQQRTRLRPSRSDGAGQPCPGKCAGPDGCGTPYETYTRWERHHDVSGCRGRWSIDLPEGATS